MRRVTRLRQPKLLLSSRSTTQTSVCQLPSSARSLSSTPKCLDAPERNRWRERLWKGPAPGPADPYAQPTSSPASTPEQRELEAYQAELAELQAQDYDFGLEDPTGQQQKAKRPPSRLKTFYKRTRAPTEKQVSSAGYSPATSAEGLEEVGGTEGWWDRDGHWGPESAYEGFATATRIENAQIAEVMLRQAVSEALALRKEREEGKLVEAWLPGDRAALDRALGLRIKITEEGVVAVRGNTNAVAKGLVRSKRALKASRREARETAETAAAAEVGVAEGEVDAVEAADGAEHFFQSDSTAAVSADEAGELAKSWDEGWKDISLDDPRLKFAITKRVFQLTGHRLPDAKLARAETVGHVLDMLVRPPPPTKVVEALHRAGELELPNVAVHERRVTPIDREKSVGRWKLIEKELEKRDLPVTGHEGLERHREARWEKGGS